MLKVAPPFFLILLFFSFCFLLFAFESVHRSDSSAPAFPQGKGSLIDARGDLSRLRYPLLGCRGVSLHHGVGSRLILCVFAAEVTLEVILCEYSRRRSSQRVQPPGGVRAARAGCPVWRLRCVRSLPSVGLFRVLLHLSYLEVFENQALHPLEAGARYFDSV